MIIFPHLPWRVNPEKNPEMVINFIQGKHGKTQSFSVLMQRNPILVYLMHTVKFWRRLDLENCTFIPSKPIVFSCNSLVGSPNNYCRESRRGLFMNLHQSLVSKRTSMVDCRNRLPNPSLFWVLACQKLNLTHLVSVGMSQITKSLGDSTLERSLAKGNASQYIISSRRTSNFVS